MFVVWFLLTSTQQQSPTDIGLSQINQYWYTFTDISRYQNYYFRPEKLLELQIYNGGIMYIIYV